MRIYFSGLGGVALGPLAEMSQDAGYEVVGSEPSPNLMTAELEKRGVVIHESQDGSALQSEHEHAPIDWFVYTAALPGTHPELVLAKELGIRVSKRDELVQFMLDQHNMQLIAISGTHGKTNTTGMLVWVMQQLGIQFSYLVGSTLPFGPSGKFNAESQYFVYECDEFDKNFLHFRPELSLITSIDHDHIDTYPTDADYAAAFREFIGQSKASVLWQNDANRIGLGNETTTAWCLQSDEVADIALPGEHSRRNGTLVLKSLERLDLGDATTNQSLLISFPGTNRRFEKIAENLYTDYGHHPVEVAATLQMARELSDRVVLVYQPHQNTRQHEVRSQYTDCMVLAEKVYWLPTYLSREKPELEVLSPQQLSENITNKDVVEFAELNDSLWSAINQHRGTGALVLCMGAGSIDGWLRSKLTDMSILG